MKNILIIIPFLASISISAQNISKINSDFELSDSLTYETEVRIYQGGGITNYSSLFRMFKDFSENWKAEFYEHYAQVDEKTALRTEKQTLQSESEMEFVFLNLIRSHILDMPNQSEIHWKLVKRGDIRKVKTIYRGEIIEEFEIVSTKISILDGEGFIIQVDRKSVV